MIEPLGILRGGEYWKQPVQKSHYDLNDIVTIQLC